MHAVGVEARVRALADLKLVAALNRLSPTFASSVGAAAAAAAVVDERAHALFWRQSAGGLFLLSRHTMAHARANSLQYRQCATFCAQARRPESWRQRFFLLFAANVVASVDDRTRA